MLVCRDPVILPFYHSGMARVMPEHGRVPRVGQTVAVTVGEPIDVSDLTCQCSEGSTNVRQPLDPLTQCCCTQNSTFFRTFLHEHAGRMSPCMEANAHKRDLKSLSAEGTHVGMSRLHEEIHRICLCGIAALLYVLSCRTVYTRHHWLLQKAWTIEE